MDLLKKGIYFLEIQWNLLEWNEKMVYVGNLMTFNISGLTIIPFIFDIVKTDFKEMRLKRVPKYVFLDVWSLQQCIEKQ